MHSVHTNHSAVWKARFLTISIAIVFCVFSEWLFFVTKPSFLSAVPWPRKILVLVATSSLPLLLFGAFQLLFQLLKLETAGKYFLRIIGAAVVASSLLLMIDNFTVTLFEFGIRSLQFPRTIVYIVVAVFLYVVSYRWLVRTEKKLTGMFSARVLNILVYAILLVALGIVLERYVTSISSLREFRSIAYSGGGLPNILLIGSDGMNADHMSVYGYERDTTPFISQFGKSSLVCDNAYANASRTLASLVSMLTGKHPTDTRVTCMPDILRGLDGYQHLPGILKQHGYHSIQLSVRDYGDALDANMRMAFDKVNFRRADELAVLDLTGPFLDQESAYLVHQSYDRLSQRILHIFGLQKMPDALAEVLGKQRETYPDSERLKQLLEFMDASPHPFFAHVHFMGTHRNRIKNPSKAQPGSIAPDGIPSFYDDAIKRFDDSFQQVVEDLSRAGKLDSTIVVLYSDHGWKHGTKWRVPLIVRFPKGAHAGRVEQQVQNIDIAPTILEYLKITKPKWMSGVSLISAEISPCRPVLSVWPIATIDRQTRWKLRAEAKPPFYTLGSVSVVACNKYYKYDLERRKLSTEQLPHADCSRCSPITGIEAIQFVVQRLQASGYDTSLLGAL